MSKSTDPNKQSNCQSLPTIPTKRVFLVLFDPCDEESDASIPQPLDTPHADALADTSETFANDAENHIEPLDIAMLAEVPPAPNTPSPSPVAVPSTESQAPDESSLSPDQNTQAPKSSAKRSTKPLRKKAERKHHQEPSDSHQLPTSAIPTTDDFTGRVRVPRKRSRRNDTASGHPGS
jgi:hypothetical protein